MTDQVKNTDFSPDKVLAYVQARALYFWRDLVDVPSGEEMRRLKLQGAHFGSGYFAYLKVTPTETICASASVPEREPDDKVKQKVFTQVTMTLANSLMKLQIAAQKAGREEQPEGGIVQP